MTGKIINLWLHFLHKWDFCKKVGTKAYIHYRMHPPQVTSFYTCAEKLIEVACISVVATL